MSKKIVDLKNVPDFRIEELFLALVNKKRDTARRPWAHHSKKGPGRKHQQGSSMTKKEREEA